MEIRGERLGDAPAIGATIVAAFASARHASGTEAVIVDALRSAGSLSLSLVADEAGEILGHVAFSPVTIDDAETGWLGLGPVAVRPDRQGVGIGQALIRAGLERLRSGGAAGVVLVGDPGYYSRFGFRNDSALHYPGAPAEYFQALRFTGDAAGEVAYHPAFDV